MTREEAIEEFRHSIAMSRLDLKVNKKNMSIEREIMVLDSIARNEIALKALEQEPCEDVISREELLKAIDTWDRFGVDDTNSLFRLDNLSLPHYVPYIHYDDVIKCIKGMPPVKPQEPKTGHWMKQDLGYKCSYCTLCTNEKGRLIYNYCPNCGAKMESEDK